jgi:Cu(I)/Ag(I) efflux system membrane fusion protein
LDIRVSGRVALDQDLYGTQVGFLAALKNVDNSGGGPVADQNRSFLDSTKARLLALGMTAGQIEELAKSNRADESLYKTGFQSVWVYASVYEEDMPLVHPGQKVIVETNAFPGEIFNGTVAGVALVLDPQSRTARVRIHVEDKGKKLRAEMFTTVTISVDLGKKLAVPEGAVMDSGTRKVVYLVKDNDRFIAKEVALGRKASGYYEVISGLEVGDTVMTSGNFLVDSESKLRGVVNSSGE